MSMDRRTLLKAGAGALAVPALASRAAAQAERLKVGFVYVGPVGDHGWSYQHDVGRKAIEAAHGARVETTFVERVSEGPDAERVITQLARTGCRLIFTTSFGFMNPTAAVARRFPNVMFEHCTGYTRLPNLATYDARFYEGRYVIGQIAAKVSRTGTMGYVGAFPIPEVVQGINAYMLGAQSVRPDMKCRIVWINSWYDPGKEADGARVLFDQGVDVIAQHTDSPAPLQIAEQRGLKGFGQATDMTAFAPNAQLTAIVDDWNPYYIERVRLMLENRWTTGQVWGGFDSGMVKMGPYANMPDDVKQMAQATEAAIREKRLHPFAGPIVDQAGQSRVAQGAALTDEQLTQMNWYVRGIEDRLPT
jgi:simple sugar transport system substrate-binding protein